MCPGVLIAIAVVFRLAAVVIPDNRPQQSKRSIAAIYIYIYLLHFKCPFFMWLDLYTDPCVTPLRISRYMKYMNIPSQRHIYNSHNHTLTCSIPCGAMSSEKLVGGSLPEAANITGFRHVWIPGDLQLQHRPPQGLDGKNSKVNKHGNGTFRAMSMALRYFITFLKDVQFQLPKKKVLLHFLVNDYITLSSFRTIPRSISLTSRGILQAQHSGRRRLFVDYWERSPFGNPRQFNEKIMENEWLI